MTAVHLVRESTVARTPRVMQLEGMFDLPATDASRVEWDVSLPTDEREWQIGLIVGPSGSGKSTILAEIFGGATTLEWSERAVVDDFESDSIRDVTAALSSVGFSSPPAWLRPFSVLSNGEQFRASMARLLLADAPVTVVDEFTSVVDRTVAQVGSAAVARFVRSRPGRRLVAASCHYDIVEWLQPDWMYDTGNGVFEWRCLQRRPAVVLEVERCDPAEWASFRRHHYLSHTLPSGCRCFLGSVEGRPATFVASRLFPHPTAKDVWQEARCVCLPDFQGVGIGNAMSELVAAAFKATGRRYRSVTSHPAMIRHRARSPLWDMDRKPSRVSRSGSETRRGLVQSASRLTASFEYRGPAHPEAAEVLLADLPALVRTVRWAPKGTRPVRR